MLHAHRGPLEIQVSDSMAVNVIHLFEIIQIDVDQSEDAAVLVRLLDAFVQQLVQREAVVDGGKRIEFGAAQ